jgi:Ca-activated chloride channel family protein
MKSHDKSTIQQVVFITDGAVGNEEQLLSYIYAELNQRRLFTVGIGSAPNSYFMKEAAHFGRGTFSFIGSPNEVKEKMQSLFNRIEKPVLTQLSLVTDGDVEILPQRLPDLYAGEPLSVAIRVNPLKVNSSNVSGLQKATITGRLGQSQWQQHLTLNNAASQKGLSVHWGREEIQHWMRASIKGLSSDEVKKEVLRVALKHHLVSKYTSLVAVDVTPSRPLDKTLESKAIKSKMPAGFSPGGFSQVSQPVLMASGATNSQLLIISGLLALGMFAFVWLRNSRISGIFNRV